MSKEIDIDFVISWVNDEDTEWQEKKKRYLPTEGEDVRPARYRDWGLLPFLFRGFDVFTPWVRFTGLARYEESQACGCRSQ